MKASLNAQIPVPLCVSHDDQSGNQAAYAIEAVWRLWLGVVFGFIFVCYLIVLWVIGGQSERDHL
ncbi:MAG: hypothetical protein ACYC6N_25575 [Pirellulaceae bacterium]